MESFYNLLKIIICIYLGSFTYITYQILFYYQKRCLFIKTIIFFLIISLIIIKAANKYNISIFHIYLLFYIFGLFLAQKYLNKYLFILNKNLSKSMLPIKKILLKLIKIILLPSFYPIIREKINIYLLYRKFPYLKPKTIHELF